MKPEHDRLMREIFDNSAGAAGREATLARGRRTLWRRRLVRRARHALMMGAILLVPAAVVWRSSIRPGQTALASRPIPAGAPRASAPDATIQELTDDQLLALFPNTPVALAEVGGKKRLFFPRPGDEARFITRVPDH